MIAALLWTGKAWGQRIRIPSTTAPTTVFQGGVPGAMTPAPAQPPTIGVTPGTTLGQPAFDPYATSPGAASTAPSLGNPSFGGAPAIQTPTYAPGSPPTYPTPNGAYPNPAYAQQPPVLYPNACNPGTFCWPQAEPGPYMRLFQDVRMRYTWLAGSATATDMQSNDIEAATTINFPNFLWSNRPIHLSPTFILSLWDGPNTDSFVPPMMNPTALPPALPSKAYSAYLSSRWQPQISPMFGGDIEFNAGVYSDFNSIDTDSVRLTGTGLFVAALTPTMTLKGGVTYLDRVDLKLLPAGGVLWTPNPHTRFDIYFPRPKLAQYLTTLGNTDVWWFVSGEYGGGSWTVSRLGMDSSDDRRVDINDIRVGGGLEWTGLRGVRGFAEAAYVFNRELVFASRSAGDLSLDDTIMVRGGLAY